MRGRVGRSNHQAYAYLLYQAHKALSEDAKARLEAIREFTHLGSGLQVAMRDLEIRGAGNLLGAAQSGFIGAVGFETYCELLAEAIAARKGAQAQLPEKREAVIDVKLDAYIPNDYIPQVSQKIAAYQELANARSVAQVDAIAEGLADRFGTLPEPRCRHEIAHQGAGEERDPRRHRQHPPDLGRRGRIRDRADGDRAAAIAYQEQVPLRRRPDHDRLAGA